MSMYQRVKDVNDAIVNVKQRAKVVLDARDMITFSNLMLDLNALYQCLAIECNNLVSTTEALESKQAA